MSDHSQKGGNQQQHMHVNHNGHEHMDHSSHDHMDHSDHEHMDHGDHAHMDHGGHAHMDHGSHAHMDHGSHEHMDHGSHEHMDHGSGHGGHHDHHAMMVKDFKKRFFISLIITIPVLLLSPMIQGFLGIDLRFTGDLYILFALATVLFVYGGKPFLTGAIGELKQKAPAMMTLIAFAISIAYVYSSLTVFVLQGSDFFWELATLIVIMLLGHWIEMKSVMGASKALDELVKLMPQEAHRIMPDGETEDVPVAALEKGDRVLVKPGEKIPIDGTVFEGRSDVNEAMVTGESVPVDKAKGDEAIGGAINGEGILKLEVSKTGDETFLSR